MIVDGRRRFSMSLRDFYRQTELVEAAISRGILIPPLGAPDAADPPALAFVNPLWPLEQIARWICRCPDCPGGTAYVWLDDPRMFCVYCGNRGIGGRWRAVALPPDPGAIEALLLARPSVQNMAWEPWESLDAIRAGTAHILENM